MSHHDFSRRRVLGALAGTITTSQVFCDIWYSVANRSDTRSGCGEKWS